MVGALVLLALPGSAYIYQGEELGAAPLVRYWHRIRFQPNGPGFPPGRTVAAPARGLGPVQRGISAHSIFPANRTTLEAMPKVKVPRKNVTPGEVVTVLSRRLGPGYQVESNGGRRVMVRRSALRYASISIVDQPGASVFGVHGGGFLFLRLVNTFGTARQVADALRRSPEFRSL